MFQPESYEQIMNHFPRALALILLLAIGCLAQSSFEAKVDEWTPVKLNSRKTFPYGSGWALGEIHGHSS